MKAGNLFRLFQRARLTTSDLQSEQDTSALQRKIVASGLFDNDFYMELYPDVRKSRVDPLIHYLTIGWKEGHSPSAKFDPQAYLRLYPDVAAAQIDPLAHYVQNGIFEGRFAPPISKYAAGQKRGASFFSQYGFAFESSGPNNNVPACVEMLARTNPSLKVDGTHPDVSIIIPLYGQMPFLLNCLESLSQQMSRFSVEIIVSDDASPEEEQTKLLSSIPWIRYERRNENGGFIACCNSAVAGALGDYVVLLNSDTRVLEGWLDELIGSFKIFPNAGLVGSKLLNADGTLQEAGGIYWSDGAIWNYGRNQDPEDPKFCFARQVDYVSGASIAIPVSVWRELGGLDEFYRPAYCEDVDLAFKIKQSGKQVWLQPLSMVIHYEGMTHGRDETQGLKAYQTSNMKKLHNRWGGKHKSKRRAGEAPDREANRSALKRMLVVDAMTHTPDKDAGSFVCWQMLRAFRELGYHQTFVPLHNFSFQQSYTEAYQRVGVHMMYAPQVKSFDDVLSCGIDYDYVLIYRYGVAQSVIDKIREMIPTARIIFGNIDLHFLRIEREAELMQDEHLRFLASRMKTDELNVFTKSDCNLTQTSVEIEIVQANMPALLDNMIEHPWITELKRSNIGFDNRRHVMFLGGFAHQPNVDAMEFFTAEVWPKLIERLPSDAKLLIVGNSPPDHIRALTNSRIVVTGLVPDLVPYFEQARVFVAPLRFGAGIKGKMIESLAHGVPSVATSIACEGIGLVDGEDCVIANSSDELADGIVKVYENAEVWTRLQQRGYDFIERRYSFENALSVGRSTLELADRTWMKREEHFRTTQLRDSLKKIGLLTN